MCLGKTHVLVGAAVGASWSEFVAHSSPAHTAVFAGFTGALALWPDIDQCGSTVARSLGFVSTAVAWVIRAISGGHRHGTHTLPGIAITAALARLSCQFLPAWPATVFLALVLTFSVSGMLEDLGILRSHPADLAAALVSAAVIWRGYDLAAIPLAVLLGCCAHAFADMLTDSGVMLFWPFWKQHIHLLPEPLAFTTGSDPESFFAGGMVLLLGWLALNAARQAA